MERLGYNYVHTWNFWCNPFLICLRKSKCKINFNYFFRFWEYSLFIQPWKIASFFIINVFANGIFRSPGGRSLHTSHSLILNFPISWSMQTMTSRPNLFEVANCWKRDYWSVSKLPTVEVVIERIFANLRFSNLYNL